LENHSPKEIRGVKRTSTRTNGRLAFRQPRCTIRHLTHARPRLLRIRACMRSLACFPLVLAAACGGLAPRSVDDVYEMTTRNGVVPEASAHWGEFQGTLTADHFTEVNQPVGLHRGFDAIGFYRTLLRRFHDQGW
jgi:hypothetical protein